MRSFWSAAQLEPNRTRPALHLLELHGYETYCPRIRERRVIRQRVVDAQRELFVGYCFVLIVAGRWWDARWCPGVVRIVLAGERPAVVPDAVIAEIKARERNGLIELPRPPGLKRGDAVRVSHGPLQGLRGLYEGMKPRERVAVLLQILGDQQRVELAAAAIEPVEVVR
jgi:transcriptional antiterminator RfaH